MNSAYLYVRVSTDEQKRKGYSLPEQEDRLLRHCEQNNIEVKVSSAKITQPRILTARSGRNYWAYSKTGRKKTRRMYCLLSGIGSAGTSSTLIR